MDFGLLSHLSRSFECVSFRMSVCITVDITMPVHTSASALKYMCTLWAMGVLPITVRSLTRNNCEDVVKPRSLKVTPKVM